jgi:hypothetical protein
MKHFFTLSLCCLALSLSAQEAITYPYNPDGNADGTITVPDLQDFLGNYGSPFSPAEIMVGDTALGEWIQILYQALEDQQAVIEAMQGAEHGSQSLVEDSFFIVPNGINTLYIDFVGTQGGHGANNANAQGYVTYIGCPGGKAGAVKLILTVNEGDSISVDFGTEGVDAVLPPYGYSGYAGSSGTTSSFYINGVNLLNISGGIGGQPVSYCGITGCCSTAAQGLQNNGDILYPTDYGNYPIFVTETTVQSYNTNTSLLTIKY